MTDWTSQQRRLELQRLLSLGKPVVASDLANEWHCSERTVRRDLRDLRDFDHLPIEYDRLEQTWYYTREVAHLPAMLVDAEDRRALLFSLQVAAQFENTPLCESARRLSRKLLDTLPPEHLPARKYAVTLYPNRSGFCRPQNCRKQFSLSCLFHSGCGQVRG